MNLPFLFPKIKQNLIILNPVTLNLISLNSVILNSLLSQNQIIFDPLQPK